MNNSTSVHKLPSVVSERSPGVLIIILLLVCIWILIINALVFVCLLMSRHDLKNFVNIQMLSFSLTDMFVGIFAIPVTLTYQITTAFPYFETCAGIFYGYCISQAANLFHAFGICIHRIIIIKRNAGRKETNPKSMMKTLFLKIALVWILSVVLVSIPFGLFGQFGQRIDICSLNGLFADNYIYFCAFMDTILTIPQIGMNIVYVYMFRFLLTKWRSRNTKHVQTIAGCSHSRRGRRFKNLQVHYGEITNDNSTRDTALESTLDKPDSDVSVEGTPIATGNTVHDNGNISKLYRLQSLSYHNDLKSRCDKIEIGPVEQDCKESNIHEDCIVKVKQRKLSSVRQVKYENNFPAPSEGLENRPAANVSDSFNAYSANDKNNKHFFKLNRKASKHKNDRKLSYEGQKDVLITIGLILLVVNVFMTPLNLLVVIELLSENFLTREVKFVLMAFALMNSALNPVIYALRIKLFRKAFIRNWRQCMRVMCFWKTSETEH